MQEKLIYFGLFFITLWAFGFSFHFIYASLIGEIIVGVLFVSLFELLDDPESLILLGDIGLMLLVFEG